MLFDCFVKQEKKTVNLFLHSSIMGRPPVPLSRPSNQNRLIGNMAGSLMSSLMSSDVHYRTKTTGVVNQFYIFHVGEKTSMLNDNTVTETQLPPTCCLEGKFFDSKQLKINTRSSLQGQNVINHICIC